jgi:hypothetical protein
MHYSFLTAPLALLALAFAPALNVPLAAHKPVPAVAEAPTVLEARSLEVVSLLNGKVAPEDIFTNAFRAAVADAQIKALSASLTAQFGPAVEVALLAPRDGTRAALEIRFERGLAKGGIAIDPAEDNRINELRFTSVDAVAVAGDTAEAITADLAALPGSVNAWFGPLDGGAPLIAIGADTPLALGSTFKLYVLATLAEDVKAGRREWTDVVPLTEKSFPSGQMQNWPESSPVTLHTLASLMISISDNTATDQLIAVLGQERILKLMRDSGHSNPEANNPFLTTRQVFLLKTLKPDQLEGRTAREVLANPAAAAFSAVANPSIDDVNAAFAGGPKALQIEWFASPADLAKLLGHMLKTADAEAFRIMAINPSATPAIKANWHYIGFKGGSEPGVLNLTWLLQDRDGSAHVLTLGWNNPAAVVDNGQLETIAQRILLLPR